MDAGTVIAGTFEIERLAGAGGMGAVYRARDRRDGAPVALKVLRAGAEGEAARFEREAELLARLAHPGIVRHLAHGVADGGRRWLAMEWLEGEDLAQRLARGPLAPAEAVAIGAGVAAALGAAHALGVVHRDVKPANLFLAGGDPARVKILDFGIARQDDGAALTRTGFTMGTPAYMAPEQARGVRGVTARADVFSLGCVLFECLAGRPPFQGEHALAVVLKVMFEDAPRLREIVAAPDALDDLVARMLSKDPSGRPADGAAVAAELAAADVSPPLHARRTERPPALGAGEQRHVSLVLLGRADPVAAQDDATAPTLAGDAEALSRVRGAPMTEGARVEPLLDGSVAVVLPGRGTATDQAAQAAACALGLRDASPGAAIVIATGRGEVGGRLPVGEAIDRAARLLRVGGGPGIRLDEVTVGLLDTRFEIAAGADGLRLVGRGAEEAPRTLLGRPTPCVGREAELGLVKAVAGQCFAEPVARAVLVTGPAGVGKSRLRQEIVRWIAERDEPVEILVGRGEPLGAGSAFGILARALRRAAGIRDDEPVEARRARLRARTGRHVAPADRRRVAEFLGEMVGAPFPDDESAELAAARRDPILMSDQIRRAWEDFVAAESAAGPVALVIEDLHWGDVPTVALVDAALRVAAERPFLVLALARPDVAEIFPDLWAARDVSVVRLGALTRKASERLVRSVLGAEVPAETAARIVDRAAGNAFYLEELIRAVAEGKGEDLPETVLAMIEARLAAMPAELRRLLRAASVFGQVFWRGGVAALLGAAPDVDVPAALEELARSEVVTRRSEARFARQAEYVFRHALVRDAAYATLTDGDRALGHRLAAEWLEALGEADAMALAAHSERGGRSAQASGHYRRAAEQALEGNDLRAALDRAERGVRSGAEGEVLGALRLLQAEASRWLGDNAGCERFALEAMARLPAGGAPWCAAAAQVAVARLRRGASREIVALYEEIRAPVIAAGGPSAAEIAAALLRVGRNDLADPLLVALEASAPAPAAAIGVQRARAYQAVFAGDLAGYLTRLVAILPPLDAAGDARSACALRINLGDAYNRLGAYPEAERVLGEAAAVAQRMGLDSARAAAETCLGWSVGQQGRLDEAQRLLDRASAALEAQGDRRFSGITRVYQAGFHALAGDLETAEREAREAASILDAIDAYLPFARATLARILLARGRTAEALDHARAALGALDAPGGLEEGEALVGLVAAEALEESGDHAGALATIEAAEARLLAHAARIGDEAWRRSFLERVPENARTLELARRWGPGG